MKPAILTIVLFIQLIACHAGYAQLDSIQEQGSWRTYIVHLPNNYNSNLQYPLVINLHGLNANATLQQSYSQFDLVADSQNFIVVYPNAVSGSWEINGTNDVDFIAHLIDTIRSNFSCNSCLFICGMSQGGFLSYKLACSIPQTINAIGVVSGNISQNLQNNCSISNGLPILHFHGTADSLVKFNGTLGIPSVPTTINWLVNQNNCNSTPVFSPLANINLSDSSSVEKYEYSGGTNGSEVIFYKVINGGHTWPGASPLPPFGFTNLDIQASQLIGAFFSQHCSTISTVNDRSLSNFSVYPNPFTDRIQLHLKDRMINLQLISSMGQVIYAGNEIEKNDFSTLPKGIYFIRYYENNGEEIHKKIIKQ